MEASDGHQGRNMQVHSWRVSPQVCAQRCRSAIGFVAHALLYSLDWQPAFTPCYVGDRKETARKDISTWRHWTSKPVGQSWWKSVGFCRGSAGHWLIWHEICWLCLLNRSLGATVAAFGNACFSPCSQPSHSSAGLDRVKPKQDPCAASRKVREVAAHPILPFLVRGPLSSWGSLLTLSNAGLEDGVIGKTKLCFFSFGAVIFSFLLPHYVAKVV